MCLIWLLILNLGHLYLSNMWSGADPRINVPKRHVLEKDWTTCSKFDNHSRLSSQQNTGEPI